MEYADLMLAAGIGCIGTGFGIYKYRFKRLRDEVDSLIKEVSKMEIPQNIMEEYRELKGKELTNKELAKISLKILRAPKSKAELVVERLLGPTGMNKDINDAIARLEKGEYNKYFV